MKAAIAYSVVFFCVTMYALTKDPWVAPGFALWTAGYLCLIEVEYRRRWGKLAPRAVSARFALTCFAIAWILGCFGGHPDTLAFWAIFGAVCTIFAPVLTVMGRSGSTNTGQGERR